jgi:hypothetical protein
VRDIQGIEVRRIAQKWQPAAAPAALLAAGHDHIAEAKYGLPAAVVLIAQDRPLTHALAMFVSSSTSSLACSGA